MAAIWIASALAAYGLGVFVGYAKGYDHGHAVGHVEGMIAENEWQRGQRHRLMLPDSEQVRLN